MYQNPNYRKWKNQTPYQMEALVDLDDSTNPTSSSSLAPLHLLLKTLTFLSQVSILGFVFQMGRMRKI